jgi:iron complex outermembrane recepter protein
LAGLIQLRTHEATPQPELRVEMTGASNSTWSGGLAAGGAIGEGGSAWRVAGQQFASDGFMHDAYLQRNDTNGRDETTLRGKLHLVAGEHWQVDVATLYADIDNGYDAFALDNSTRTRSDRPGQDAQRTAGGSLKVSGVLGGGVKLLSTTAYADSDIVYSFDGDWGNDAYWGPYAPYDYFSRYDRDRSTVSEDLRLQGSTASGVDWVGGVYAMRLAEDAVQRDYFAQGLLRDPLKSAYEADHLAAYGEAEWRASSALAMTVGLRVESRSASYADSDGTRFDPRNTMVGGHVSLAAAVGERAHWYATVSRGYKAGGFNIGQFVPEDRRQFAPEYLWNAETGLRTTSADARWQSQVALFHMWREEEQVATSFQLDPGDPLSYVFYTDNAAKGRVYGIESSGTWQALPSLSLGATLGLLHSEYVGYRYGDRNLDGRAQSHAPDYQYSISAQWGGEQGWMARGDLSGAAAFYFDASHDQRSEPYTLLNLKAGYARGPWSVHAWVRNLTDEKFAVRGFYFGLEPPDYADKLYVQRGDGRLAGVTLQWRW